MTDKKRLCAKNERAIHTLKELFNELHHCR
jgi:hypothetical protein